MDVDAEVFSLPEKMHVIAARIKSNPKNYSMLIVEDRNNNYERCIKFRQVSDLIFKKESITIVYQTGDVLTFLYDDYNDFLLIHANSDKQEKFDKAYLSRLKKRNI